MGNPIRRLNLPALCAVLALSSFVAAVAAPALAATAIHFQRESYPAFLGQLRHREVHAVVLHPQGYKAHISLDDGGHMTATYPASEVAKIEALARARGASFTIATATHKATAAHHKLRYIAAAVLIVVILVVLAVLLVGRRRAISEEELSADSEPLAPSAAAVGSSSGAGGAPGSS